MCEKRNIIDKMHLHIWGHGGSGREHSRDEAGCVEETCLSYNQVVLVLLYTGHCNFNSNEFSLC